MKSYEMDMCHGPLFGKIIRFLIPLILSSLLQLMFNAADMMVAGHFTGSVALAAIGCCTALISMQVNLFIGISTGASVVTAKWMGAQDNKNIYETVHTGIALALVGGVLMILICNIIASPALQLMKTPDDVLPSACLYIKIYFCGMPFLLLYNFGAAILRAAGDTKRPLFYLTIAGVINVLFNMLFVIVFQMGVSGVAIATVISQAISAGLVIRCLVKIDGSYRLKLKEIHIYWDKASSILKIGLSAGFQSVLFNIANMMLQSSINTFGSTVMAGNTASNNMEHFCLCCVTACSQAAISFISQNRGAKEYKRMKKAFYECVAIGAVISQAMGMLFYFASPIILKLYTSDPEVMKEATIRLGIIAMTYGLNAMQDNIASGFRGMGSALAPLVISLVGICGVRIFWLTVIFPRFHTRTILYSTFPVSWIIVVLVDIIAYQFIKRKRIDAFIE